ncbi:MAG TPA: 3-phosphoshikimate 1-carboxyvinyltransferase [Mycobacteriales bacterium]|jgi:3-phosphoshikimate 1-carboxyvinyltransferase|nr:3-phosphoshikimate 1-carboxyvinyltransferase [Mycobacteriales bacterium]
MPRVTDTSWPTPHAAAPVRGAVVVPGSKSVTNRALLLSALSDGASELRRPLRSRDTELMAGALHAMGTGVSSAADDGWVVQGAPLRGPAEVDVGLAGTVMRFVPPVATLASGDVRFDGDERARERPMRPLLQALVQLGADVADQGRGRLPFTVVGHGGLAGGEVRVDASASSQIVSALLLVGARWDRGVRVVHVGDRPVPNTPHLRMTAAMLRERGVAVDDSTPRAWSVEPGVIRSRDVTVEPDLSSAAPFLAAACVTGGAVVVRNWPESSTQPGAALPELLEAFGATWRRDGADLVVTGGGAVTGADLDLRDGGELTPVVAALAACAKGPSTLTGIDYLRGHETDRIAALARELTALGARVSELDDGLRIEPGRLTAGVMRTYDDHRLVMAGAVLGLVTPGLVLDDAATVAKTYPGFVRDWTRLVTGSGS